MQMLPVDTKGRVKKNILPLCDNPYDIFWAEAEWNIVFLAQIHLFLVQAHFFNPSLRVSVSISDYFLLNI